MDLIDEITREASFTKKVNMYKRALPVIILLCIIIAVIITLESISSSKDMKKLKELNKEFLEFILIDENEEEKLKNNLEKIKKNFGNAKVNELAQIKLANIYARKKELNKSSQILHDLLKSPNNSQITSSYAKLMLCNMAIDYPELVDPKQVKAYFDEHNRQSSILYYNFKKTRALFLKKRKEYDKVIKLLTEGLEDTPPEFRHIYEKIMANAKIEHNLKALK